MIECKQTKYVYITHQIFPIKNIQVVQKDLKFILKEKIRFLKYNLLLRAAFSEINMKNLSEFKKDYILSIGT